MTPPTRHLDLGCGSRPHNPYRRDELHGVDIADPRAALPLQFRQANLALQPIPYPDDYFDSVSAYDFIEHVPRVLPTADGLGTRFPFVVLMNEIWRVLAPGGLFYASTPAYPHAAAFQDPTHVNIITIETHKYFTRPETLGRMYGFCGDFEIRRVVRVRPAAEYEPPSPGAVERFRQRQRERRGAATHLVWEFAACK